ncbi:MAG: hypothetical protein HLUCCX10_05960 [Algoriphagus marincola HL-49]|uniref:Uncharacterized protein n=1 Tax=Algoriphagus marincola HL-49 TaxID=1305737 RepID=A0A0P7YQU5_9BACT|nr:MAG: hypothetical protein HLUCCX10_05960 [Algoriphagus marincola HL-49]
MAIYSRFYVLLLAQFFHFQTKVYGPALGILVFLLPGVKTPGYSRFDPFRVSLTASILPIISCFQHSFQLRNLLAAGKFDIEHSSFDIKTAERKEDHQRNGCRSIDTNTPYFVNRSSSLSRCAFSTFSRPRSCHHTRHKINPLCLAGTQFSLPK